jgi:UDP-2-acetamido-3-amino-2,3-dideoxy-glucuronate N-acetyltransferase
MKTIDFFKIIQDERGFLKSIELENFRLFKIKRIFVIEFKNKISRGNHAHRKCKQYILCCSGKVKIQYIKNNIKKEKILSTKTQGIYISPKTWVILKPLTKKTEIICLCDIKYLKSDYITDYKKFIKISNVSKKN